MSTRLQEIERAAALYCGFGEGHVVELRALGVPEKWADKGFTHSGYFDNAEDLAAAALQLDRKGAGGLYVMPNPAKPDLLARAKNRTVRGPKSTTTNDEILRRRWLLLDFDPERPAGIASTGEELSAARARAVEVARFLKGEGFPGGVLALSGNGAHLMYRLEEPAEDGGLTRRVLEGLAARFPARADGEGSVPVEIDTAVHNAARIWKLPGTTARKGDATEDRPHRRAKLLRVADPLGVVPTELLERVAAEPQARRRDRARRSGHASHTGAHGAAERMPTEKVRALLSSIPPRPDYDDWFRIVAAVHAATGEDAREAEALLREWSSEETEGEYRRKLESGFDGSITAGTLIELAKQNGYTPPSKRNRRSRSGHAWHNSNAAKRTAGEAKPSNQEWPEPVPLGGGAHAAPAPLPTDALPEWVRRFAETVSGFLQCPTDLPFGLTLSAIAAAAQKKAVIQVKDGYTEPLSLWTASVLPSGEKKSPAFGKVTAPFKEHERQERERIEPERQRAQDEREVLESRLEEAKKRAVKATGADDQKQAEADMRAAREALEQHVVPRPPQLWTDDTTPEQLGRLTQQNSGRMAALSAEGDLFKYMGNRYSGSGGGPSLNLYKAAWTGGEAFRDDRMGREGTDIANPALTVGICVQPPVLERMADKDSFRGEGILARFLFAVPRPMAGRRKTGADVPALDKGAVHDWARGLKRLLDLDPKHVENGAWTPHVIELSEAAQRVRWAFEDRIEAQVGPEGALRSLRDWAGKIVGQAVRIAGLLHVAEGAFGGNPFAGKITEAEMGRAVAIAEAYAEHALRAFALIETDERRRLARYVWKRIRERRPKTKRELWQATKSKAALASVDDLNAPLMMLGEHGLIRVTKRESTGGRPPSPLIEVNPKADEMSAPLRPQYPQKYQNPEAPPTSGTSGDIGDAPPPAQSGDGAAAAGVPAAAVGENGRSRSNSPSSEDEWETI